jgi:hypothetical protein
MVYKAAVEEYAANADFYHDMLKFNLCNGAATSKAYLTVSAIDLPPEVDKLVTSLYRLFKNKTIDEIYRALGLTKSHTNKTCPLETKWVYHYKKKYKTLEYRPDYSVSTYALLKPLDKLESLEYASMF